MRSLSRCAGRVVLAAVVGLCAGCGGDEPKRPPPSGPAPVIVTGTPATDATPTPAPTMRFTTVGGDESGIDLVMTCGKHPSTQIVEVNGGGLGLIDYDGDGDLDLFVANGATMDDPENGPGSRLYENLGRLRFRDVTAAAGIALRRWAMGVSVGDYDGDGRDDLHVTCYGPNVLLRNAGGRFVDSTAAAGVGDPRWGTTSAFGDLDGDGDLDLYVVNYLEIAVDDPPPRARFKRIEVMAGPHGLTAQSDVLYENLGDGTFRDVSESSGCRAVEAAYGLGVVIIDFDGDGRQDIFVGNDSMANFLFNNLGDLRFEEIGTWSGIAANADGGEQASMGIGIADVDGNGYADVFTTNFSSDTNTLHLNLGAMFFDDRTMQLGLGMISRPFLGWSCGFYDFDVDGDEDLLMVNGHVYPEAGMETMDSAYRQPPLLFVRRGPRFVRATDATIGSFLDEPHRDRVAVFGDLDADGDVDVTIGELNGPIRVLRNDARGASWLTVEPRDERASSGNHRGLGSRVEVICDGSTQRRWIHSGGYQSSSAPNAHFGFGGRAGDQRATVEVTWPDGWRQRIEGVRLG
ncbi:MAG: CRTAC1 family protein, partial [Planctomycetota bacterium]